MMTESNGDIAITCPVRDTAKNHPDQPALVTPDKIITYREYDRQTTAAAAFLRETSITDLTIVADNTPTLPPILMAAFRTGVTVVLLSSRYPAGAISNYINDFKCSHIINLTTRTDLNDMTNLSADDFFKSGLAAPEQKPLINLKQPATVMLTSGTSAHPKAVRHSYGNHYYNALGSNRNIPFRPGDRWLWSLPAYHVGGLSILFRAALGGGAVVIDNTDQTLSEKIIANKITHVSLVPTQLYRLIKEKKTLPELKKQLSAVLIGGGSFPENLLDASLRHELPIYKTYGLTETASQVCTTGRDDMPHKAETSGRPLDFRRLKISLSGEILVKGHCLFEGYLEKNKLVKPFDNDGWFATGDCGVIDNDGYLRVTGRKDNLFISGGENIQPEEIERCLCRAENITASLVVPVPSEEFGFRPAAFIKTEDNSEPDRNKLEEYLQLHLPRYKIPDYFFPWPEKLKTDNLKLKREDFISVARRLIT